MLFAIAVALAAAGGVGIFLAPVLAKRRVLHSICVAFAAGTLLTMVLVHVLPEAQAETRYATILFVLGFVAMLLLQQRVLQADPCCGHEHTERAGLPSFLAMALCSINDGILVHGAAESAFASPLLWALLAHRMTASFSLSMLLKEIEGHHSPHDHRLSEHRLYLAIFVLLTPIVFLLSSQLTFFTPWVPHVMALAGGALLYVLAASLVPRVEHVAVEDKAPVLITFLLAVLLNIGLATLGDSEHEHGTTDGTSAPR
jgi:zinc transporter ZupT